MAGARGLWRATGMTDADFGKPIIAVVNSFTQFVPGHVHLKDLGQLVAREIEAAGGVATRRYYEQDDECVLPRKIASFHAFENAMSLDIAMGGSTNTVLHLLAAAHEAGVAFTMADIHHRPVTPGAMPLQGRSRQGRRAYGRCPMSTGPVESWPSWASWTGLVC